MSYRYKMLYAFVAIFFSASSGYAEADIDMAASKMVREMLADLGNHGTAGNNGAVIPCVYRGTKKITILQNGSATTYMGEYRNCRENGTIRDGIFTIFVDDDYIVDSSSQRSINGELFDAAIAGDAAKVRTLIKAKADVNYTETLSNIDGSYVKEWSPLMSSVLSGNLEVMKLLIANGAWVNYMNSRVMNALWLAANNGRLDMVRLLTVKGAYVNNRDIDEVTPLMAAAMSGSYDVVEYLLRHKADINLYNQNGDNALMLALQNGQESIARLLIMAGSEVNRQNRSGATALMIAAVEGNETIIKLLMEKGADVTLKSDSGKTALDYATLKGNTAIRDLLQQGTR